MYYHFHPALRRQKQWGRGRRELFKIHRNSGLTFFSGWGRGERNWWKYGGEFSWDRNKRLEHLFLYWARRGMLNDNFPHSYPSTIFLFFCEFLLMWAIGTFLEMSLSHNSKVLTFCSWSHDVRTLYVSSWIESLTCSSGLGTGEPPPVPLLSKYS